METPVEKSVENLWGKSVEKSAQKSVENSLEISQQSSEINMNLNVIQKENLSLSLYTYIDITLKI